MKHILDSGNRELAEMMDEPHKDENGYLLETYREKEYPIGYSDSFGGLDRGTMWQFRILFFNGRTIGEEVIKYPWNILQPLKFWYEVDVDENLSLSQEYHGKQVAIGRFDQNCVIFKNLDELVEFVETYENELPCHETKDKKS